MSGPWAEASPAAVARPSSIQGKRLLISPSFLAWLDKAAMRVHTFAVAVVPPLGSNEPASHVRERLSPAVGQSLEAPVRGGTGAVRGEEPPAAHGRRREAQG